MRASDKAVSPIEVTEGTLLGDPDAVARILARLREAGTEAAHHDFGTGYAPLGDVHRLPLKMIKIDRSFVDPLGSDRAQRSSVIVNAILALSHSPGLEVVTESIETDAQRAQWVAMGCVHGRGYLFGGPQRAAHWLRLRDGIARASRTRRGPFVYFASPVPALPAPWIRSTPRMP